LALGGWIHTEINVRHWELSSVLDWPRSDLNAMTASLYLLGVALATDEDASDPVRYGRVAERCQEATSCTAAAYKHTTSRIQRRSRM